MSYQERYVIYQKHLSKSYLSDMTLLDKFIQLVPLSVKWTKNISDKSSQMGESAKFITFLTGGNALILA